MSTQNPTFIDGAIPVQIYLTKLEFQQLDRMGKMIRMQYQKLGKNDLKSDDIRDFIKFATLSYYNIIVMKVREEEAKLMAKRGQNSQSQL